MNFENVILESEQEELFIRIVEARRRCPRDQWDILLMIKGFHELIITANGCEDYRIDNIAPGDVDELVTKGLLRVINETAGEQHFSISADGYQYYDWLMKKQGKPVERIEKQTLRYLEFDDFRKKYPDAYSKIKDAEKMLWSADVKKQYSLIGIRCREAMQAFSDQLYLHVFDKPFDGPKDKTVDKIRSVIETKRGEAGEAVQKFLEALLPYWGTVSDLVQRNVHANEKKGRPINMEDSRRSVFQTMNIMMELHRTFKNNK